MLAASLTSLSSFSHIVACVVGQGYDAETTVSCRLVCFGALLPTNADLSPANLQSPWLFLLVFLLARWLGGSFLPARSSWSFVLVQASSCLARHEMAQTDCHCHHGSTRPHSSCLRAHHVSPDFFHLSFFLSRLHRVACSPFWRSSTAAEDNCLVRSRRPCNTLRQ